MYRMFPHSCTCTKPYVIRTLINVTTKARYCIHFFFLSVMYAFPSIRFRFTIPFTSRLAIRFLCFRYSVLISCFHRHSYTFRSSQPLRFKYHTAQMMDSMVRVVLEQCIVIHMVKVFPVCP
jgi:hypothetical protein